MSYDVVLLVPCIGTASIAVFAIDSFLLPQIDEQSLCNRSYQGGQKFRLIYFLSSYTFMWESTSDAVIPQVSFRLLYGSRLFLGSLLTNPRVLTSCQEPPNPANSRTLQDDFLLLRAILH